MTRDLKALRELEKRLAEAKVPLSGDEARELSASVFGRGGYEWIKCWLALQGDLSAAVAFVERVLPGWFPGVEHIAPDFRNEGEDDPPWCANINGPVSWRIQEPELGGYEEPFFDNSMAAANTPALALCLAAVRALISQGEQ